jgi:hypothetical protein
VTQVSAPDQYPEDEFDAAARGRTAQGSHRERARRASLLPLIAILALLVIAVWVIALLVGGGDDEEPTTDGPTPTETFTDLPDETAPEGAAAPRDGTGGGTDGTDGGDGTESDGPAGEVDLDANVTVLNGAGVAGIAGRTSETLAAAGWTTVEAGNIAGGPPEVSTVYYADPAMEASAAQAASDLGIEVVELNADMVGQGDIVVVLRADYQE